MSAVLIEIGGWWLYQPSDWSYKKRPVSWIMHPGCSKTQPLTIRSGMELIAPICNKCNGIPPTEIVGLYRLHNFERLQDIEIGKNTPPSVKNGSDNEI